MMNVEFFELFGIYIKEYTMLVQMEAKSDMFVTKDRFHSRHSNRRRYSAGGR